MMRITSDHAGLSIPLSLIFLGFTISFPPEPVLASFNWQENDRRRIMFSSVHDRLESLPIQVRGFKHLPSNDWIKKLEIHFENTSDKPIYFIHLHFGFLDVPTPNVVIDGKTVPNGIYGFSVYHGDKRFRFEGEKATDQDKPINPGEKFFIKLPETETKGLVAYLRSIGIPESSVEKIEMNIGSISFGDGSGVHLIDRSLKNRSNRNPN